MNDMSQVIVPKSDQLNSDDLIAGPRTITITDVAIRGGTEQPVSIRFDGDEGRPWKPCKSMSRVLVAAWGPDAKVYVGRSVTLYRDPKVKWAGMEVGGIRISHMSHIERDMLLQLTETRGKRAPHMVKVLSDAPQRQQSGGRQTAEEWAREHIAAVDSADTVERLDAVVAAGAKALAKLQSQRPDLAAEVETAYATRRAAVGREGKPDEDFGESFADDFSAEQVIADTEETPAQRAIRECRELIDAATDDKSWRRADQRYQQINAGLSDADSEALDAALQAKRRELSGN
jgi:hypothetical protein